MSASRRQSIETNVGAGGASHDPGRVDVVVVDVVVVVAIVVVVLTVVVVVVAGVRGARPTSGGEHRYRPRHRPIDELVRQGSGAVSRWGDRVPARYQAWPERSVPELQA
jgi:hypothetical protein